MPDSRRIHLGRRFVQAAVLMMAALPGGAQEALPGVDFKGKLLLAASDTDMLASAYMDGRLGPSAGQDALSVIRLDRPLNGVRPATVHVTNSVTGPPAALAVTPDGRYAIVIETQGPRPGDKPDAKLTDLPSGKAITVVDLIDPDKPKVVQQIESFERALSVSVNSKGTLVAVALGDPAKGKQPSLVIFQLQGGQLSNPATPAIPGFNTGDALISAEFVPHQDVLALVYVRNPRLAFVQVNGESQAISLIAWGNSVPIDPGSFLVRFTPNGEYGIVNAMYIGADMRGTVASIKVNAGKDANGAPHHTMVSRVDTGAAPEGLAVSPDGKWVATTNLERSAYPVNDSHQGYFSSITLAHLDPDSGTLERAGDFPFYGILPEAAVFDNSSRFLAVACFGFFDPATPGGSIDIWRIAGDYADPKRTELVKTSLSIPVARGPQSMAIVR